MELVSTSFSDPDADVRVWIDDGEWQMERGDFRAVWNPERRQGHIRQTANPYSIDSVLRIVHTLLLAREGGFLLHASSAVRNGKAFCSLDSQRRGRLRWRGWLPPMRRC